jgi:hypothetical protein
MKKGNYKDLPFNVISHPRVFESEENLKKYF